MSGDISTGPEAARHLGHPAAGSAHRIEPLTTGWGMGLGQLLERGWNQRQPPRCGVGSAAAPQPVVTIRGAGSSPQAQGARFSLSLNMGLGVLGQAFEVWAYTLRAAFG